MDRKSKNELFLTACDYLFSEKFVTSQKDLSAKIGITPASFSRIKSGLMGVSDETIRRMNEAFGNIFDMRYFRGQSDHFLLEAQEKPAETPQERVKNDPQPIDHSSLINAMLAAKDETIAELRARIADKESVISAQHALIIELRHKLSLFSHKHDDSLHYEVLDPSLGHLTTAESDTQSINPNPSTPE